MYTNSVLFANMPIENNKTSTNHNYCCRSRASENRSRNRTRYNAFSHDTRSESRFSTMCVFSLTSALCMRFSMWLFVTQMRTARETLPGGVLTFSRPTATTPAPPVAEPANNIANKCPVIGQSVNQLIEKSFYSPSF